MGNNETTPSGSDSLLGEFTKGDECPISDITKYAPISFLCSLKSATIKSSVILVYQRALHSILDDLYICRLCLAGYRLLTIILWFLGMPKPIIKFVLSSFDPILI